MQKIVLGMLCLLALLSAASCGSPTKTVAAKHVNTEELDISLAKQTIALGIVKCIHAEQQSGDSGTIIGARSKVEGHEIDHAVRELIEDFRKKPTMHTVLAEEAENLQSCWPWLTREIRSVLIYG